MAADRPPLTTKLASAEFLAWYWLKDELLEFCKANQLRAAGSKPEIAERIVLLLSGSKQAEVANRSQSKKPQGLNSKPAMPAVFELSTIVGTGWRCNPNLGKFFKVHCGPSFRFNAAMRNFIHNQSGKTLAEAVQCFKQSVAPGAPKQPIITQNEYNRHTREFFAANPNATREAAIDAWWAKRNRRKL
jgi:SAP domain-containing new25/Domain of unknown function (DUF6434)